jgi:excisionase family DNA binding protein
MELMTCKELAEYMQINIMTVYRLIKTKKLPFIKLGGAYRFPKTAIDRMTDAS